jgi:hypothetical protein
MNGMLIPNFSIRHLLGLMTVLSVVSLVVKLAIDGQQWAIAVSIGLGCLVTMFGMYALTFLIAAPFGMIDSAWRGRPRPANPFATQTPPPQILPPEDPE